MATILLSAAGAAIGGGFGGTVLGLSGAVIGRAVGATLGRAIDQRLLGAGSQAVETGKIDRLRLTSASEGQTVGRVWGRMRVGGQVIWATRFLEHKTTEKVGGKGAPSATNTQYSYSVSLAVAVCEGEILRIGRVWADGAELDPATVTMRVYPGSQDQLPDSKISAVEGADMAPAYRGVAYVVFEDLQLAPFGNRVPQFSFEVSRAAQGELIQTVPDLVRGVRGVALIPGTGEYSLATTKVREGSASWVNGVLSGDTVVNQHAPGDRSDFEVTLSALDEELPACEAVSLVVSWFGNDLRCGTCQIAPKVSDAQTDSTNMPWSVSGLTRATAGVVPRLNGSPVYGGTPSDQSVIEAIVAMREKGKAVTFYPFVLMEQLAGNGLPDPWSDADNQPVLPWRGRITLSVAPGRDGSPDRTAMADAEVASFVGAARVGDFTIGADTVSYTGPEEFSLRRFVLHYAHLCKLAGGVDAFCIGSELRALTQIRGAGDRFPVVEALRELAADVRAILGPECKIGYAADWSEYFGYKSPEGFRYFHLDPLWADENIDFIGIDNYMPLSDWREGETHADADWGSIYNLDYLQSNIEGGEGFEWYYENQAHRAAQIRTPITDGAHGEPWIWRYKDLRGFWENHHFERVDGGRASEPTRWVPRSKPIWFTEFGCAAIDKATNQPNKFLDPKSSESSVPRFSDGRRDELIQMQYLRAMTDYWSRVENNPVSDVYDGLMIDMSKAHVWAWDARPYPQFPALSGLWADAENYARGHWISGRAVAQPLASVVAEICECAGAKHIDVSGLYGFVRGYVDGGDVSARGVLQSLMLAYGFEAVEREGKLVFKMRDGRVTAYLGEDMLAYGTSEVALQTQRAPEAELSGRVRLHYTEADGEYGSRTVEAIFPDERAGEAAASALPLALTRAEAQRTVERWLTEARVARDGAQFALPPSLGYLGAGDVVALETPQGARRYRIDRAEQAEAISVEAVRVEPAVYQPSDEAEEEVRVAAYMPPVPVTPIFLDLPLMTGQEVPHAPHVAAVASPWPGSVAVYSALEDDGYALNTTLESAAIVGETLTPLRATRTGLWDRGAPLRIRLVRGSYSGASDARVFAGANLMAIGDGVSDSWELFQFAEAEPVQPGVWEVRRRLRGQLGTDALMPEVWPEGSVVVLMNAAVEQINLLPSARNLTRHYRIGSALRGYDDASYSHTVRAFSGVGLRPLSPAHLRVVANSSGWDFSWLRRTRIDGDAWEAEDVPLGESAEQYRVRVRDDMGAVRREVTLGTPLWHYAAAAKAGDGIAGAFSVEVAQISDRYGEGLSRVVQVAG
ncbi:glycoside hydrolase TIM-barrel-like domain-containing protein [Thioclava sp. A2]|uniref:baseplate multidomain protein megatron n=1 Tax=Thioclava sp. FCG-A2 TaxID=3080562 RepID=UPI00295417FE|nr:glycoside hydrolase TIM-barrel-like domain-containing protein [Thioclava sp. A2]MDV7269978.1 glycoside hydrolase TIM-barrel-like domain-containing protein [Thioclava sp. A2]